MLSSRGREVLRLLQWQERGAQDPPMTGSEPGLEASERTPRVWDDIAKRYSGDGVALFCIINEHSRLNNTYREDNKQNTNHIYR